MCLHTISFGVERAARDSRPALHRRCRNNGGVQLRDQRPGTMAKERSPRGDHVPTSWAIRPQERLLALQQAAGNRVATRLAAPVTYSTTSSPTVLQRGTWELAGTAAGELDKEETRIIRNVDGEWIETDENFRIERPPARSEVEAYTAYVERFRSTLAQWKLRVDVLEMLSRQRKGSDEVDAQLIDDFKWIIADLDRRLSDETSSELVGVFDATGTLQAIALYHSVAEAADRPGHVFLNDLVTNPARFSVDSPEGVKRAALAATRYLLNVSKELGYEGRIRLQPLPSSVKTYASWGFEELPSPPMWEVDAGPRHDQDEESGLPSETEFSEKFRDWAHVKAVLKDVKIRRQGAEEIAALDDEDIKFDLDSFSVYTGAEFSRGLYAVAGNQSDVIDWTALLAGLPTLEKEGV